MNWLRNLLKGKPAPANSSVSGTPFEFEKEEVWRKCPDQAERKRRSEERLTAEGIRVNPHLPMIESEEEITPRTNEEIANRLSALVMVAFKASDNPDQALVDTIVAERGIGPLLTQDERAFIADVNPDERSRAQFSWRCEAAWPLLWALQHTNGPLGLPRDTCDVPFLSETVYQATDLLRHGVRPTNQILDEADLIYRCHWAVRQASLDGANPPNGLHPGVTMERHHALNWLIGYNDHAEWDDVTTDT